MLEEYLNGIYLASEDWVMGKKKQKEAGMDLFLKHAKLFFAILLDFVTSIYLLLILVVLPLYNHWDYSHIGSEKVAFLWRICKPFTAIVSVCGALYILLFIGIWYRKNGWKKEKIKEYFRFSWSATDFFVACYGIIVVISYLFSDYKERALLGRSSWGMGALIQIAFVFSYFCISRVWTKRKRMILLAFPASVVLFVLGCFNRFGLYPIPMKASGTPEFISLAGNINWYCGYMVMPVFAGLCYAWSMGSRDRKKNILFGSYLLISFAALVTNGSSSGFLTLAWVLLLIFLMSIPRLESMLDACRVIFLLSVSCLFIFLLRSLFPAAFTFPEDFLVNLFTAGPMPFFMLVCAGGFSFLLKRWGRKGAYPVKGLRVFGKVLVIGLVFLLFSAICLIVMNTLKPGSIGPLSRYPMFTFSDQWGSYRGATWKAGVRLFSELDPWKRLIGIGSDSMDLHIKLGASEALREYVYSIWPNNALTNAHCEPLTVMIHNGLLGMTAFVGILATSSYRYLKQLVFGDSRSCLVASCGMAIAAYGVHNLFSFQQVMNGPVMFVILGIGEAYYRTCQGKETAEADKGAGRRENRRN